MADPVLNTVYLQCQSPRCVR